jgi:ATP-dependent Clp protease ATP-binding subunit ClpA
VRLPRPFRDIRTISRLLKAAESEAQREGAERPGPEHLVLAAFDLPDQTARRALEELGITPGDLRSAVADAHADALRSIGVDAAPDPTLPPAPPPTGPYRLTDPGQQVFQTAVGLAKHESTALNGAHVLAAACALQYGTFPRAIAALGVDRDNLRSAANAAAR